jgi:Tol biopolymer transport system component
MPITGSGCCINPQWSRDSEWILFIHAPQGLSSAGLYGVPRGAGPVTQISARVGVYSEDTSLVAYLENEVVYIERWVDGARWTIPSSGRRIYFSPSGERVAWEIGSSAIQNQDVQIRKIWVAQIDGSGARELVTVHGGGFQGWVEGGEAIIVSGRLTPTGPAGLWRVQTSDGAGRLLFAVDVPRDVLLSPGGTKLAFTIAFEAGSGRNGLWVLPTNGDTPVKLSHYGAYRWRGEDQLVVIPYDFEAPGAYLLQFDIGTDLSWSLTSPSMTPLPIANNDWEISPDGLWMVYFSSEEGGLSLLALPEVPNRP